MTLAPTWLLRLSQANPSSHIVDVARASFRDDLGSIEILVGLACATGLALLGLFVANRVFQRESAEPCFRVRWGMKPLLAAVLFLVGCSGDPPAGSTATDASSSTTIDAPATHLDAPLGVLTLTSSTLTNATFPDANTCTGPGNTSPVLTWTGNAMNAQSFVLTLTDPDANNLIHWAIYDIPSTATGLPATVQTAYSPDNVAGAHQAESFTSGVFGYQGPCPPQEHTYRFDLYAVDVASLPGTSMAITRNQIATLAQSHMVAKASLTASYQKP